MTRHEWLDSLEVGDHVYIMDRRRESCREHVVKRVTKTQVTLDNNVRYTRSRGEEVGAGVTHWSIDPIPRLDQVDATNTATKTQWETARRARRIRTTIVERLPHLDVGTLTAVMAVIDTANPGKQSVAKREPVTQ